MSQKVVSKGFAMLPNLLSRAVSCPRDRGWARALMTSLRRPQSQVGCARCRCGAHGFGTWGRGLFNYLFLTAL